MTPSMPVFDATGFATESYVKIIDKPWGHEKHLVPEGLDYMMKIIHIKAGAQLSLQVHDTKRESWTLLSGSGKVIWENADGALVETWLEPGVGYTCRLGQRHRLAAAPDEEVEIFEASTPEAGITYRLEDDYARPDETPEQRKVERGEVESGTG